MSDMPLVFETDDEIAPSPAENLYMLLYELNITDRLQEYTEMFNSDIILNHIIKPNLVALQPLLNEYEEKYSSTCLVVDGTRYLHIFDLCTDKNLKRKLQRAVDKLLGFSFKQYKDCSVHPDKECQLLSFEYGFLCFLHLKAVVDDVGTSRGVECYVEIDYDVHEEAGTIDEEQERIDAEQQFFPAISPLDSEVTQADNVEDEDQRPFQLALPQLPYFSMENGFDYVLMSDILRHFNIREDYCFAALAQNCDVENGFVESICDKYLLIDTDCDEAKYQDGRAVLERLFNEARVYERSLPSSEEFNAALHRLGLENMGKEPAQPSNVEQGSSSSVPLWAPNLLEEDENQFVRIVYLNSAVKYRVFLKFIVIYYSPLHL